MKIQFFFDLLVFSTKSIYCNGMENDTKTGREENSQPSAVHGYNGPVVPRQDIELRPVR
jgi:hypothetical protein